MIIVSVEGGVGKKRKSHNCLEGFWHFTRLSHLSSRQF